MLFTVVDKVNACQSSSQKLVELHLNERKYCPSYSTKLCAYVRTPEIYVFISMCKCRSEEENSGLTEITGKKTIEGKDAEIKEMNNS